MENKGATMAGEERPHILRSEFADDPEIGELVQQFVSELPGKVEDLSRALQGGDAVRLRTLAHQLKGSAGGYGFPTIGEVACRVEQCLKSGGSPEAALEKVRGSVDELLAICRRAIPGER
jgi:HPt (histidine-containing phosphotransfer) domain-containing protein